MGIFRSIGNFFSDVQSEFKRVTWPTWAETKNSTGVVLVVTLTVAAILGGLDVGLSEAVKLIIK
ncbi:MAG: preprotein translocase subunit SecE [Deltaproteobacteria bacterium]|nr:preprotein translocase subunit SecE [Deltaproteobacteria bacterium]